MFLHLCVILFKGGGVGFPACITGHMTKGGSAYREGRVCIQTGSAYSGGGRFASRGIEQDAPPAGTRKVSGMHPTGMFQSGTPPLQ